MKKRLLLCLILVSACSQLREKIVVKQITRVAEKNFKENLVDQLPDGLHVVLCGAGSPIPDPKRSGPCTAVIAGKNLYIVDTGSGSSKNLTQFKIPQGHINAVLLTHFHSDHIDGLGELIMQRWAYGTNSGPLPVLGPTGVSTVVEGFNKAYQTDDTYRIAHHGAETLIPSASDAVAMPFTTPVVGSAMKILKKGGLTISAIQVDHFPVEPAVGYRFDYKGRSVVISGDTAKSLNIQTAAKNADLLVHEGLNREMVSAMQDAAKAADRPRMIKILGDIPDYHTAPTEAAEIAQDAGVGFLLFTHIVPPLPYGPMEKVFASGVSNKFDGPFRVGKDGTMVSLPANSRDISVTQLDKLM